MLIGDNMKLLSLILDLSLTSKGFNTFLYTIEKTSEMTWPVTYHDLL